MKYSEAGQCRTRLTVGAEQCDTQQVQLKKLFLLSKDIDSVLAGLCSSYM